ncbi:MAG: helix-turn-helix transcriptional regulator [Bacteroidales bacterium]|nr:helix-turn-helix transcriptional regulator [Bacteroidales bacterium]
MIAELLNYYEIAQKIASDVKELRLRENLTQQALAKKSGVSLGSLKRFESSYEISLKNLIQLGLTLRSVEGLLKSFEKEATQTIDEIIKEKKKLLKRRQRGRINY